MIIIDFTFWGTLLSTLYYTTGSGLPFEFGYVLAR